MMPDDDMTTLTVTLTPSELKAVRALADWWQATCRANGVEDEPDTLRGALEGGAWLHDFFQTSVQHAMKNADDVPAVKH